jgi:hypothetical protein
MSRDWSVGFAVSIFHTEAGLGHLYVHLCVYTHQRPSPESMYRFAFVI